MKNTLAIAMLAAASVPMAAHAESYYVGAGIGSVDQNLSIDKFGSVSDRDVGFKLFTGYNFDKNFGIEAGYTDFGKAEFVRRGEKNRARSFYAAGTATLPLGEKFALTAKLGIAKNRSKLIIRGEGDQTEKKADALLGVGATYAFTKTISAFVEYENYGNIMKPAGNNSLKATVVSTGMRFSF
ncbi:outer membrane beta-barrel protein [Massilia antarctica]|uniref:outer membrane beta-barrel protein n=1 Tax=Massilia antarctica TaxID=2765360 RepID=UPI0006BD3D7D|nr:outer membrane beta-barrel protein [Massilia sp. H27-R4]CUI03660.1 Outer membrane protein A precursor [Janthinobacterium sp. CG23_2]CUU27446.1 Outer membrane protein A precursor [Janthinobacterium sp. CG23_2]